jgi:hypothetical protein
MQPFEVDRHGTQLQVLANSLCRHIEQRKGPDGTTVWANLEGHTLLDDISSLRRELQSMRAVISRLEAENGSRKAENHKLQVKKNQKKIEKILNPPLHFPNLDFLSHSFCLRLDPSFCAAAASLPGFVFERSPAGRLGRDGW